MSAMGKVIITKATDLNGKTYLEKINAVFGYRADVKN